MKTRQNSLIKQTVTVALGAMMVASSASTHLHADSTFIMMALTLGAFMAARPAIIKSASPKLKTCKI